MNATPRLSGSQKSRRFPRPRRLSGRQASGALPVVLPKQKSSGAVR